MAVVPVKVPSVGESISEGILAQWMKSDGDAVDEGESLYELETDKASSVFPAPSSGILKITVAAGDTVAIGATIGTIDPDGTPAATTAKAPAPQKKVPVAPRAEDGPKRTAAPAATAPVAPAPAAGRVKSGCHPPCGGSWRRKGSTWHACLPPDPVAA